MTTTLFDLVGDVADRTRPAIDGFNVNSFSYSSLIDVISSNAQWLRSAGVGPQDRVAIVLPNGPAAASSFLAVASCAVAAPLNPAYTREEFAFYLEDLAARAAIVLEGGDSAVLAAAEDTGTPVLRLVPGEGAGAFRLHGAVGEPRTQAALNGAEADALVLHTSGTTARPKIVPLTQANLAASASNIAKTLRLTPEDRALNVMPLFHIHGLVGVLLSSLAAGAAVHCTPGFDALKLYSWLEDVEPSWYSAVPTMHQTIVARAKRNRELLERGTRLRLIRSSSAALAPQVLGELEATFGVPVIESYGMTEAAHQMASNPLPPAERKPGTVGPAAGPDVGIVDDTGALLAQGATGEVVIRGENVTAGYAGNPEANAKAFTDGWFRTGDQGFLDTDGYLTITGRLKEIINRGGEKISPREIDEVLLGIEGVAQAAAFAMPHKKLGEEVAAIVVPEEGAALDEKGVRDAARERLAEFKVPKKVIVSNEIPKGPTGKVQRVKLAQVLGLG